MPTVNVDLAMTVPYDRWVPENIQAQTVALRPPGHASVSPVPDRLPPDWRTDPVSTQVALAELDHLNRDPRFVAAFEERFRHDPAVQQCAAELMELTRVALSS